MKNLNSRKFMIVLMAISMLPVVHINMNAQNTNSAKQIRITTKITLLTPDERLILPDIFADYTDRIGQDVYNQTSEIDASRILSKYNVKVKKNNVDMSKKPKSWVNEVLAFNKRSGVFIDYSFTTNEYTIEWINGSGKTSYTMITPINREAIEGTDKAEAEKRLFQTLVHLPQSDYIAPIPDEKYLTAQSNGLLANPGTNYVFASLDGTTYYKKTDRSIKAVFDKAYPLESLKNLMQGVVDDNNYKLHLLWPVYGGEARTMDMSLKDFVDYWKTNPDFNIFCGVSLSDNEYSVVYIVIHKVLQYANVCTLTFRKGDFDNPATMLNGIFTSNIPQHNISSIFN